MNAMTLTEKLLARAAYRSHVVPGENCFVSVDVLLTHDVCGPGSAGVFKREFGNAARVWDRDKVVIIPDHYIFTKDEKCLRNIDEVCAFAREQNLTHFYPPFTPDYRGVCHVALDELGLAVPGAVIFGTDSHTCTHGALGAFATGIGNTDAGFILGTGKLLIKVPETQKFVLNNTLLPFCAAKDVILRIIGDLGTDGCTYQAMEFEGEGMHAMSIESRMTLCNMAVECGAKNGICAADEKTLAYLRERNEKTFEPLHADADARYKAVHTYDLRAIEPLVALPFSPGNVARAADCTDVAIDRAYIGSCTGGKIEDFVMAATILRGKKVAVPTFLVPATRDVERALDSLTIEGESLSLIFRKAGCETPAPPSCAACLGGPVDTYGRCAGKEVCISTTNRNFPGRMGSADSQTILASPYTAAASALTGHVTDPRTIGKETL